jgi:putative FmdB family regulatory protein
MPTYDYQCESCGHEYELFQSITARPKKKCPSCGRQTAKRLIGTGGGIIFKGSGFYQTDYRSESYKKAAEADSKQASNGDSKSKDSSKDSTKSAAESKPAKKEKPAKPEKSD